MKNSKTPWTWGINDDDQLMVYDADDNPVAQVISEDCEADAELICRGVGERASMRRNCHRFDTLEEATDAWRTENRSWQWHGTNTAANYMKDRALEDVREFLDWLFEIGGAEP